MTYMRTPRTVLMMMIVRLPPQPSPVNLKYWNTSQVMLPPVTRTKIRMTITTNYQVRFPPKTRILPVNTLVKP